VNALSTVQLLRLVQQQKLEREQAPDQSAPKMKMHAAYQNLLRHLVHVGLCDTSEIVMLSGIQQRNNGDLSDEMQPSSPQAPDSEKRSRMSMDSSIAGGGDVQEQQQKKKQQQQQNLPDANLEQQKQKMDEHLRKLGGDLDLLQTNGRSPVSAMGSTGRSLSPQSTKSSSAGGKVGSGGNSKSARDGGRGERSSPPASTASVTRGNASPIDDLSETERMERKRKTTDDGGSEREAS